MLIPIKIYCNYYTVSDLSTAAGYNIIFTNYSGY